MASWTGQLIRRLGYGPLPEPGEALLSWLDRVGAGWRMSRHRVCAEVGITVSNLRLPPGLGLLFDDATLQRTARRTGLRPDTLQRLTFQALDGRAVDLSTLDLSSPTAVRAWVQRN